MLPILEGRIMAMRALGGSCVRAGARMDVRVLWAGSAGSYCLQGSEQKALLADFAVASDIRDPIPRLRRDRSSVARAGRERRWREQEVSRSRQCETWS
ncbi:unnamed protein product [Chondrus crispus]|uniref:Uncharacterized protein n=1 Tax=Chondrus crispus TaxID=2769 RepID=R7Q5Q7_CHOCR|nr:unnamed protein product [Chondrus crispus]CDF32711.1 unnamed protein product [Chondrus crispus]|eukprot:XP_005712482.1 unnamed protein product [Chondrus crispus]